MLSNYKKEMSESASKKNMKVTSKGFSNDNMASLFQLHADQHGTGPLDKTNKNPRNDVNMHRMKNINGKIGYFEREI